jgi:HEAT repeat protein
MQRPTDEALLIQLESDDWRLRRHAARLLGKRGVKAAVPALINHLCDRRLPVQTAAATALGEIRDSVSIPALKEMFDGKTYGLMEEDGAPHRFIEILGGAGIALTRFGQSDIEELLHKALSESVANFRADNTTIQLRAMCVSYLGGERAYHAIKELWSFHSLHSSLILYLGRCGVKDALPDLVAAIKNQDVLIRSSAAQGLGLLGFHVEEAVEPLIASFVLAEQRFQPDTAPHLKHYMLFNAARSLGTLNTPTTVKALRESLAKPKLRQAAAVGLAYAQDPVAYEILVPMVTQTDHRQWGLKTDALQALAVLDNRRALPLLLDFAQKNRIDHYPAVEDALDRWQGLV